MNQEKYASNRRVVVAVDLCRRDHNSWTHAVNLAERLDAELVALFVEDEDLLRLAKLPFSTEISRVSGAVRNLDPVAITFEMTRQIDKLKALLAESIDQRSLRAMVKTVRGRFLREVLVATGDADFVFVSASSHAGEQLRSFGWRQLGSHMPVRNSIHSVWSVYDGSDVSRRSVQLASELSQSMTSPLSIALRPDPGQPVEDLKTSAMSLLGDTAKAIRFVSVQTKDNVLLVKQI